MFECNVRLSGQEGDTAQLLVTAQSSTKVTNESSQSDVHQDTANSPTSENSQTATSESTNCDSAGATHAPVQPSDVKIESKPTDCNESSKNLCKDAESTAAQAESDCNTNKDNSTTVEAGASGGNDDKKTSSKKTRKSSTGEDARPKETAGLVAGNRKAKDLCQTTCRLLKEQIMRVHDDLDRQWQVLREAGVVL